MKNIVRYSFYQLYKGKRITLITMAMVIISFCVIEYTLFDYFSVRIGKYYAEDVIPYKNDEVYRIDISKYIWCNMGELQTDIYNFCNKVRDIDEIKYSGLYLRDAEHVVCVYGDVMEIFGVDLTAYISYQDNLDGVNCVWIGCGLKDKYSVGDEYIYNMNTRCKVVGIIPSNKKMLSTSFYEYGEVWELDNMMIIQMDNMEDADMYLPMYLGDFYFCIDESTDIDVVMQEIYSIGEKYDIDINGVNSLEKMFNNVEKVLISQAGERYFLPFVLLFASAMGLIIATMISIRINKKDAGIMVANGMSIKELSGIYICENVIKILGALVIAYFYCIDKVRDEYEGYNEIYKIASKSFVVIALIILFVCNFSVVLYFKNKMPSALIGGTDD